MTFDDLISRRLFRIPEYQRAYSWRRKERNDLFDDIMEVANGNAESHFMATVVALRREKRQIVTDEFQTVDIVDGQQRLTTLIILLKAIEKGLEQSDADEQGVKKWIQGLLVKGDQLSLLLLRSNHDSRHLLADYLRSGQIDAQGELNTIAERALIDGMADCESFVTKWAKDRALLDLAALIKNKLAFILHEITDEATVYTVFEVLNSRGLEVPWIDRLKSTLMGVAFQDDLGNRGEIIDELHDIWKKIYRTIGLKQGLGTEALRFAATLKSPNRISKVYSEEVSVSKLKDLCEGKAKGSIDVSRWMLKVVKAVDRLLSQERRARAVTRISHARFLAVSIDLQNWEPKVIEQLLSDWERVSFRIFGFYLKDARTMVGNYVRLAYDVNQGAASNDVRKRILRLGAQYPIDRLDTKLRDTNCYEDWQEELRYVLFRYEEHLAADLGVETTQDQWIRIWESSAAKSIEHIQPQSLGSPMAHGKEIFVHRLGNLTILPPGLNSKLGNRLPEKKCIDYRNSGLLGANQVAEEIMTLIQNGESWNRSAVEKRENTIIDWIMEKWKD